MAAQLARKTVAELKTMLDSMGVEYPSRAKKAELVQLASAVPAGKAAGNEPVPPSSDRHNKTPTVQDKPQVHVQTPAGALSEETVADIVRKTVREELAEERASRSSLEELLRALEQRLARMEGDLADALRSATQSAVVTENSQRSRSPPRQRSPEKPSTALWRPLSVNGVGDLSKPFGHDGNPFSPLALARHRVRAGAAASAATATAATAALAGARTSIIFDGEDDDDRNEEVGRPKQAASKRRRSAGQSSSGLSTKSPALKRARIAVITAADESVSAVFSGEQSCTS